MPIKIQYPQKGKKLAREVACDELFNKAIMGAYYLGLINIAKPYKSSNPSISLPSVLNKIILGFLEVTELTEVLAKDRGF